MYWKKHRSFFLKTHKWKENKNITADATEKYKRE